MVSQCWASVADDGPTLKQHWVNVLSLEGITPVMVIAVKYVEIKKRMMTNDTT